MKSPKLSIAAWVLAGLAVLAGLLRYYSADSADRAPDAEFVTLQGERIALGDLRGHPVLVTFWASDCPGCIEELPDLVALHREYSARGFRLIAVAMPYDPPNRVLAIARGRPLPYPVALDPLGRLTRAFGGVQLVPNSFLIAPDGRIALHHLGRIRAEDLRAPIERLLEAS